MAPKAACKQCFLFSSVFYSRASHLRVSRLTSQPGLGCCPGQVVAAMAGLFHSRPHITSDFGLAFQERPEWIPCDESTVPAGNIPVGLYGPS